MSIPCSSGLQPPACTSFSFPVKHAGALHSRANTPLPNYPSSSPKVPIPLLQRREDKQRSMSSSGFEKRVAAPTIGASTRRGGFSLSTATDSGSAASSFAFGRRERGEGRAQHAPEHLVSQLPRPLRATGREPSTSPEQASRKGGACEQTLTSSRASAPARAAPPLPAPAKVLEDRKCFFGVFVSTLGICSWS